MDAILSVKAEQLAAEMAAGARTIDDLNGPFRSMTKTALERMLDTEMDVHLGRRKLVPEAATPAPATASETAGDSKGSNRRNGRSKKTVQGDLGPVTVQTPRDREGTFEPQGIGKHQRRVPGFDEEILALYAKGMTTRDIGDTVRELYGVAVSPNPISEITSDLDAEVAAWRSRPIDGVYPILYFDGIVVHVRGSSGRVSEHTLFVALGVNFQGKKELLGLWLNETEGAKFWLGCLTDLKGRGLKDVFIACVDGLTGFPEAIRVAYPEARVQLCLVHLVRAVLKSVTDKDSGPVVADLKKIYRAATVLEAERALEDFAGAWDATYPTIARPWRLKWKDIVAMFDFPPEIRKAISTTNAIESVNSVIRKFTRNRKIDPNADSARKLVSMAVREAAKRGTMPIPHGKPALNHFALIFEERWPKL